MCTAGEVHVFACVFNFPLFSYRLFALCALKIYIPKHAGRAVQLIFLSLCPLNMVVFLLKEPEFLQTF